MIQAIWYNITGWVVLFQLPVVGASKGSPSIVGTSGAVKIKRY
jgi:hypothetical protein